jgi:C1A family cysteine protease
MKYAPALCLLLVVLVAAKRTVHDDTRLFEDFKLTYNRQYSPSESGHRFACFRRVLDLIDARNTKAGDERHGVNQFADMCPEEFAKYYLGYTGRNTTRAAVPKMFSDAEVAAAGTSINWATKGAVTPIKNQGMCGSCWTFSATGNMEGQWFLAGHTLVGLSEEELVQCSHNGGDAGCNGGLMDNAFDWVVSNGGINSEANYPYTSGTGITGRCKTTLIKQHVATISGHVDLPQDETQMATWIYTNGPLAVAVDALTWQTYAGGIMRDCPAGQLDHGVLAVGFDDTHTPPYWIVKNSWGTSWGENGYIRIEKGLNKCGIKNDPSSAKV